MKTAILLSLGLILLFSLTVAFPPPQEPRVACSDGKRTCPAKTTCVDNDLCVDRPHFCQDRVNFCSGGKLCDLNNRCVRPESGGLTGDDVLIYGIMTGSFP